MSRVHEALRQAQSLAPEGPEEGRIRTAPDTRPADAALEQYVLETGGPMLRSEGHGSAVRVLSSPRGAGTQVRLPPPAVPGKLVTGTGPDPICVEQYRRLAGVLHELQVDKGLKSLLVTSSVPQEGQITCDGLQAPHRTRTRGEICHAPALSRKARTR